MNSKVFRVAALVAISIFADLLCPVDVFAQAVAPSAARASTQIVIQDQDNSDFGPWLHAQTMKSWGGPFAMARVEYRGCEDATATMAWFLAVGGGYNFTKWLSWDICYEYWQMPSMQNAKYHKMTAELMGTLRRSELSVQLKGRYELAFNAAGGSPTSILRWRVRAQYTPTDFPLRPYVMFELFNGVNGAGWIRSLHYLGTDIALSRNHLLDIYYLYNLSPRNGYMYHYHILGVGYTFLF